MNNRFEDQELERKYMHWYRTFLHENLKGGLISSFVLWSVTVAIVNWIQHEQRLQLSLVIICTIVPYFTLLLVSAKKNWVKKNIEFLLASTNTLAGLLFVYVLYALVVTVNYILPGLLFLIFFALLSYRFRPKTMLLAALPYVILYFVFLIGASDLATIDIVMPMTFTTTAVLFATYISSTFEKNDRTKFVQDLTIIDQKERLEEKNQEIEDSINYAKRIQMAILPSPIKMKEELPNAFTLYLPKDIVAGDFYWMHSTPDQKIFAVADCTGHGVPGAMVSVICNNGLNRSVQEFGLTQPGEILDKTRELVIKEFEKSEEEVRDGMDIALCSLEGNILKYAGAHNPLWIIRKGAQEVEEIKADKQPIGQTVNATPFKTQEVSLQSDDTIYIFSDGFSDQFGGEKGKKYKSGNFKKFLLSIQDRPLSEHHNLMLAEFNSWRGSIEQIDDVCVIGLRVR